MQYSRQPRQFGPCKFGNNCFKFAQGQCRFQHSDQGNQTGGRRPTQVNNDQRNQPRFPNKPDRGNFDYQRDQNQGSNYKGGWKQNQGNWQKQSNQPTNGQYNSFNTYNGPNQYQQKQTPKDEFNFKFCRNFFYGEPCKFGDKCNKIHGFDLQDKLRRVVFRSDAPDNKVSKLGKCFFNGQNYFIMRSGNSINVLKYDYDTLSLSSVNTWNFPQGQTLNYVHYSQKQNFIYLAAQNPKSFNCDLGIYDLVNNKLIWIEDAHAGKVTSVIHYNEQFVLSADRQGLICAWTIQGDKAIPNKQANQALLKSYYKNPSLKFEINYLDLTSLNGTNILSAGTTDGRILFWIGNQMTYHQKLLGENTKIFQVRYSNIKSEPVAYIIVWAGDNQASYVVALDLNTFNAKPIHSVEGNPKQNISLIEIIQQKLFVSCSNGQVTIFTLPNAQKFGLMQHHNSINSIIHVVQKTKTDINIDQIFILETRLDQNRAGSLSIYVLKK